jgi:hypothetical protein
MQVPLLQILPKGQPQAIVPPQPLGTVPQAFDGQLTGVHLLTRFPLAL